MLQYFPNITGSLQVTGSVSVSGSITATGGIIVSGSIASASYSSNSELLDNLDSTAFVFTSSFNTYSSSMSTRTTTLENASSSLNTASGSFSSRVTRIEGNYATTGSNIFNGAQTVCANITSTGTIIAQTLNVQQVTSSIVYSSGSNVFGCSLSNTQQFTGSVLVTGSLVVTTTAPELTVGATGVTLGNVLTDVHNITGSLRITGSGTFSDLVTINANSSTSYTINSRGRSVDNASTINFFNNAGTSRYGFIYSDASTYEIGSITGTNIPLVFSTNQGERMRITHCGNITACTIDNQGGLTVAGNVDNVVLRIQSVASNGQEWRIQSTGGASGLGAGRLFFKVGGTEAGCNIPLVLTTDNGANGGRVGIGTTNPGKKLDICDATSGGTDDIVRAYQSLTTNHAFYRSQRNGGANMLIGATRDNVDGGIPANVSIVYNTNSYDMAFGTNNTERMRITSGGDIRIGPSTTSSQWYFNYNNTNNKGGISINYSTGEYQIWTGESGNGYYQTFYTNGTERMRITSAGDVFIGTTNCVAGSGYSNRLSVKANTLNTWGAVEIRGYDSSNGGEIHLAGDTTTYVTLVGERSGTGCGAFYLRTKIGAANEVTNKLVISNTGTACFACTVCAPLFISPNWRGKSYAQTSSSGGTSIIDTCINAASYGAGNIYSVAWGGNPNAAGASYFSSKFGYIGVITGYNGNVVKIISYTQIANFENVGTLCLFPFFFDGTTECTTVCSDYTGCIRIKICGYNSSYPAVSQEVYITRLLG